MLLAVPALLYFLLAYAVASVAAFVVIVELRGRARLDDYVWMARARPWLTGALALSFLSFIGVPPLAGFFAKLVLFGAAIEAGYAWLAVVAAINTVVSIDCYMRVATTGSVTTAAPRPSRRRTCSEATAS